MTRARQDALSELRSKIAAMESASFFEHDRVVAKPERVRVPAGRHGEGSETEEGDGLDKAKRKIERLCNVREQCSSQLSARLVKDGFEADIAQEAVDWSVGCGLVDDMRFADVLVRSRYAAGRGLPGIARELQQAGIDPTQVDAYQDLDLLGYDAELDRALTLLDRKPPRAKNARDAAYRRLVQKGYSSSVASSAARQWWEERS